MLLSSFTLTAQITTEEYIATYKDAAIAEMKEFKIPASIILAQGILESSSGNSLLATEAHNHFGIKCHKEWTGDTYTMDDDEKNECFRKYVDPAQSFRDHSLFLTSRPRYSSLFNLEITDYEGWAKGLKAAGYATNPLYAELLIGLVNRYDLTKYDLIALGLLVETDVPVVETPSEPETVQEPQEEPKQLPYTSLPEDRSAFGVVDQTESGRFVYLNNGVRFIYARQGDSPESIAAELGIFAYQIFNYNYLDRNMRYVFTNGDVIYVEPLKNKSKTDRSYVLKYGEDLRDVALMFGVKLERLEKMNGISPDAYVTPGSIIKLR